MTYASHADYGGELGFGPIHPDAHALPLHEVWEARALALTLAMGATGEWNIDVSRAARETLPNYRSLSYFQVWLAALEKLLLERALVSADEIAAGHAIDPPRALARVLGAADVAAALAKGSPTARQADDRPRFAVGDRVRTRGARADHHTRLPGYARGKLGVVERLLGKHVFADANAARQGEAPEWLYTVVFDGSELWGAASSGLTVSIDAWQPYLEPCIEPYIEPCIEPYLDPHLEPA